MLTHENLEKFLALPPRKKVLVVLGISVFILTAFAVVYQLGRSSGRQEIPERLQAERDQSILRERLIRNEAERLAGQNDLLRTQSRAQAELLIEAEARNKKAAAESLKEIFDSHQKKLDEIESTAEVSEIIGSLCAEAKAAGYQLSPELCIQGK